MSRLRMILAAVLAVAALAVVAVPASASVPAANAKFCNAAEKIGDSTGSTPDLAELKTVAANFKNAAKSAPPKVKKAMQNVASLLGALATKDATELAKAYSDAGFVKNYTKSVSTYATYYATTCSGL